MPILTGSVTEIERNGATAAAAAPGPAGDRGLCDGLLSCQRPHRQIQRQLAAVRINGEKRGRRSGAGLVVTGEIMASFAGKPPPFPGAARRSDGKKRTTSEEKENDFFSPIRFDFPWGFCPDGLLRDYGLWIFFLG